MAMILEPLREAAANGVEMRCADGAVRRVYPLLATHIGDWPEMCTAGCTQLTRCVLCTSQFRDRGQLGAPARLRTKIETLAALRLDRRGFADMRAGLGLRPIWPYWGNHPYSNGPSLFQPDLLHQLWKGVFLTHLVPWWTRLLGKPRLDERYIGIPCFSGQRHFSSGVSQLTQLTGNEARAMARVFLPMIAGTTTTTRRGRSNYPRSGPKRVPWCQGRIPSDKSS